MKDDQPQRDPLWLRLLLIALRPPAADDRESIWAVSRKWLPFFIAMVSVVMAYWIWIIAGTVAESSEYGDTVEKTIAIVDKSSPAVPLILLIGVCVTYWLDILGGLILVTARYLRNKFVTPIVEKLRDEGKAEGRSEMHREWLIWYRNSEEAKAKGMPFDEPPPESSNAPSGNGL